MAMCDIEVDMAGDPTVGNAVKFDRAIHTPAEYGIGQNDDNEAEDTDP